MFNNFFVSIVSVISKMPKYVLDLKDLPEHLYKFRVFDDPNHKRILTDNELFFPSPRWFNDPFDSTIPVRYDQGSREEIINHWVSHLKITRPSLSPQDMEAEATRLFESGRFRTPQSIEDIARMSRERTYGTVGVFSLTANYENILLWSHYADKHRGFCIGFDAKKLCLFCINYLKNLESRFLRGNQSIIFRDVRYTRNYPFINAYRTELNERTLSQLLTKSIDWKYEQEYRIVWFHGPDMKLIINDGIMNKVILGCQMDKRGQEEMISVLRKRRDRISLYRAKKKIDGFRLDFEQVNY